MNRLKAFFIWIWRIGHCRGFGIQSPNDYWLVRYVINEHWHYYQYSELGKDDDWLTRKLGLLYFRLSNWRQPAVISSDAYRDYLIAGCHKAVFGEGAELVLLILNDDCTKVNAVCENADEHTVLVVEAIWKNPDAWNAIVADERVGVTFDLYYCGIVLFDKKRAKKNYIINF